MQTGVFQKKIREYVPFLLVFFVAVLWHAILTVKAGDDIVYFGTLLDGRNIWEILMHRYQTWSSRLALEFFLIPMVHCVWMWRILDVIILTSIPMLLCSLLELKGEMRWWACGLVLLYPFSDMASAGWISTTMNYLWPLWGILFIAVILTKGLRGKQVAWYEMLAAILVCIYTASQEQAAVILLAVILWTFVMAIQKQRQGQIPFLCVLAGIAILSLVSIIMCPGNKIRNMQEIEGRMPEFAQFGMGEKLYMGLANVERIFIANVDFVFLVMCVVLVVMVYHSTKSQRKTLLAGVPVFVLVGYAVIGRNRTYFQKIFVVPEQVTKWEWSSLVTWLPIFFIIVSAISYLYGLFCLMKEQKAQWIFMSLLLGMGLASGVIMGFSPTIYASANRPYLFYYVIMMFVSLWLMKQYGTTVELKLRKIGFAIMMFLVLVNIADVSWLCYLLGRRIM